MLSSKELMFYKVCGDINIQKFIFSSKITFI